VLSAPPQEQQDKYDDNNENYRANADINWLFLPLWYTNPGIAPSRYRTASRAGPASGAGRASFAADQCCAAPLILPLTSATSLAALFAPLMVEPSR
jgi:hypothetical protein